MQRVRSVCSEVRACAARFVFINAQCPPTIGTISLGSATHLLVFNCTSNAVRMSDCKTVPYLVIDAFCRCDHFVCYSFHFRFTEQPLKVPEEVLDELVYYTDFTICASSFLFYFPYLYSLIIFF